MSRMVSPLIGSTSTCTGQTLLTTLSPSTPCKLEPGKLCSTKIWMNRGRWQSTRVMASASCTGQTGAESRRSSGQAWTDVTAKRSLLIWSGPMVLQSVCKNWKLLYLIVMRCYELSIFCQDFETNRLYWTDAKLKYIATSRLDGSDIRIIHSLGHDHHPFALTIFEVF